MEDKDDDDKKLKTGLKIDNSKSKFSPKKYIDIEASARNISKKMEGRKQLAYELGIKFLDILKDRTLSKNKNEMTRSMEKEIVSNLVQFAVDTNNDESELEGMGSVALCTLLFRANLRMRDVLNDADYKMAQHAEQIKKMKLEIEKLSSNKPATNEAE